MIEGTRNCPLNRNVDKRGHLVELLRSDWEEIFPGFATTFKPK